MIHSPHVAIPDGWALWPWFVLRGAGFPAQGVLVLASPERARAVDELLDAEATQQQECARALEECLRLQPEVDPAQNRPLQRTIRALRRGAMTLEPMASLGSTLEGVLLQATNVERARSAVRAADAVCGARERAAIRDAARQTLFREAVTWQNRAAVERAFESLLRRPADASDFKTRQNERLVVSYLQRYCTKNDTIGFFGPVGWGRLVADGPAIVMEPGPTLLSKRTVYFEHWAIEAIADSVAHDPAIRPWAAPRLMPMLRIEGGMLHGPAGQATRLSSTESAVLAACDGTRSAVAVAAAVLSDVWSRFAGQADVFLELEAMVQHGWISWTMEIPTCTPRPEAILRALLESVGDANARTRGLVVLDALERSRDLAASAAGDPVALAKALAALERKFTTLTGLGATHHAGRTYAGRTLVYEDCARDLELRIGSHLVERIGPPLSLLLASARWYTHEIAVRYRRVLEAAYRDLAGASGSTTVELGAFRAKLAEQSAALTAIVREVRADLQAKWSSIIGLRDDGSAPLERSVESLRPGVAAAFAAPHPGWPTARHSSPDLMIAARDTDAIGRGDYTVVLGELHVGVNTCMNSLFVGQHPRPEELVRAYEADIAPTVDPVLPASVRGHRTKVLALATHDVSLEHDATRAWRARSHVIPIAELVVTEEDGFLRVRQRGTTTVYDVMDLVQEDLMLASRHLFVPLPMPKRGGRITLGGMVVRRQSWRFEPDECAFALAEEGLDRFIGARRWARAHGLPRFVFAKVPEETKPCYLDLESGPFVDLLAKMVRGASGLTLTEMLPSIDDCWLRDHDGQAYVSELRLAAVDPEPWRPSPVLSR